MVFTQSAVGTTAHGRRSQDVKVTADIRVMTDGDGDDVRGSQAADGWAQVTLLALETKAKVRR